MHKLFLRLHMPDKQFVAEEELAALAKKFRLATGKNRATIARELKVSRPSLIQAEDFPDKNLTKLRIRVIEKYSTFKVIGPRYWLDKK